MQFTDPTQVAQYYQALVNRDSQYLGSFFVGVKTTGIFCLPTCRARKPKKENVVFFSSTKELLQHGFRPCKICRPTENAYEPPHEVQQALQMVAAQPDKKVGDYQLRQTGLSPEKIRRWFKQHHGITFQAYQRMLRINTAYQALSKGQRVTDAAFTSGFESLSGFGAAFKELIGSSPQDGPQKRVLVLSRFTTPIGPMFVCASNQGVCLLEFTDRRMLETEFRDLQKRLNAVILVGENEHTQQAKEELADYFAGKRQTFHLSLDAPGTPFQQLVWEELQTIPYGQTRSYQEQAVAIGRPKAIRAVASANGHNRIAIVIPCHRIIGKDGSLTGYGGGLERKKWLLELENMGHPEFRIDS